MTMSIEVLLSLLLETIGEITDAFMVWAWAWNTGLREGRMKH